MHLDTSLWILKIEIYMQNDKFIILLRGPHIQVYGPQLYHNLLVQRDETVFENACVYGPLNITTI